jgi:hypothetical protein
MKIFETSTWATTRCVNTLHPSIAEASNPGTLHTSYFTLHTFGEWVHYDD